MLRKDVKLGFAIGGVMLAVLVVYVLVVPGTDRKGAQLLVDDQQSPQTKAGDKPGDTVGPPVPIDTPIADKTGTDKTGTDKAIADKSNTKLASGNETPPPEAPPTQVAPPPAVARNDNPDNSTDVWAMSLSTGKLPPTMMTTVTPTPQSKSTRQDAEVSGSSVPSSADKQADATLRVPVTDKASDAPASDASASAASPVGTGRTHIVQKGEMLTSIAAAVYGDSRQWKRIAAANPNVNPNRLKVGSTLVIPAAAPAAAAVASAGSTDSGAVLASATIAPVNPQTHYQVQANDSLYRISIKLYGKADHVDKIYNANKDAIGPDPARLKLHMILKLPEPPTSTLTNTASR